MLAYIFLSIKKHLHVANGATATAVAVVKPLDTENTHETEESKNTPIGEPNVSYFRSRFDTFLLGFYSISFWIE